MCSLADTNCLECGILPLEYGVSSFCFPGCKSFGNIVNILTPYYSTNQSNIVGLDAFSLNWQLQLCPYHIVRLVPVEYLQLWKGVFAGITLLESNALLLRMKVRGQGTLLRTCCYAVLSHSSPQPQPTEGQRPQKHQNLYTPYY